MTLAGAYHRQAERRYLDPRHDREKDRLFPKGDPAKAQFFCEHQDDATGQRGRNHFSDRDEYLPTNRQFDEFFANLGHSSIYGRMRNPFVESIRLVVRVAETGGFRVALIGGFALPFYGVQRATGDVDFLVEASGSAALHEALLKAGADCLHRGLDSANYAAGRSKLTDDPPGHSSAG